MFRVIKASTSYQDHYTVNHGSQRFSVYVSNADDPIYLSGQVSEIHPYDDGDYAWAKITPAQILFIKNQKVVDKMTMYSYEPDEWESPSDYIDDVIDSVCVELRQINKSVKPRMIHN